MSLIARREVRVFVAMSVLSIIAISAASYHFDSEESFQFVLTVMLSSFAVSICMLFAMSRLQARREAA